MDKNGRNAESYLDSVLCGDSLTVLRTLPSECVQMCVTSPPYYGLRDYGVEGQLGNELSPDEYVSELTAVFREVKRVLREDGTLWLNIADSYAGSGKGAWDKSDEEIHNKQVYHPKTADPNVKLPKTWNHIKPKDMIGIPWMLAFSLRHDGWYLRSDIIWEKPNGLPESVRDRPTKSYEHLFLLSKSPRYFYNREAIMEPIAKSTAERYKRGVAKDNKYDILSGTKKQKLFEARPCTEMGDMRNARDVWRISTNQQRIPGHYAIFPEKLIEPCIMAGSREGDTVLDPFIGSGTTGAVARRLSRHYIGIDLNPDYCQTARERIQKIRKGENTDGSQNQP